MSIKISKQDLAILKELQRDNSRTSGEIADAVHMSQAPCWRRINRMDQGGIIARRIALLDRAALGLDMVVFASVSMSSMGHQHMKEFEDSMRAMPEVVECYTMAGEWDYLLKIIVRDIQAYERFIREQLLAMPLVRKLVSHIAVTEIKNTTELPLDSQYELAG